MGEAFLVCLSMSIVNMIMLHIIIPHAPDDRKKELDDKFYSVGGQAKLFIAGLIIWPVFLVMYITLGVLILFAKAFDQ